MNSKYDTGTISCARQQIPHFLSRTMDGKLIFRRNEIGGIMILADDQETAIEMSAEDAKDFASWILLSR